VNGANQSLYFNNNTFSQLSLSIFKPLKNEIIYFDQNKTISKSFNSENLKIGFKSNFELLNQNNQLIIEMNIEGMKRKLFNKINLFFSFQFHLKEIHQIRFYLMIFQSKIIQLKIKMSNLFFNLKISFSLKKKQIKFKSMK
jgi:hypothetical protein